MTKEEIDAAVLAYINVGYSYEEVSQQFDMKVEALKKVFRLKSSHNILIAFKFDHNIPLDTPIYKLFNAIRKISSADKGSK